MYNHSQNMNFKRPNIVNGTRLHYHEIPKFSPKTYKPYDPDNITAQIKLYRYFRSRSETDPRIISKDQFMEDVFCSYPQISKLRVGRIFKAIMPYRIHLQRNPNKSNRWTAETLYKWRHPLELQYGLEFLILTWLPHFIEQVSGDSVRTAEVYIEELDILFGQTPKEDRELVNEIISRGFQIVSI